MTIIDKEKLKLFKENIQNWVANQNYNKKQTAVADPSASGNSISFIDTITQDTDGKINPTKKTIPNSSQSSAGLMSAADKTKLDGIGKYVTDISQSGVTFPSGWTRYGNVVIKDTVSTINPWSKANAMSELILVTQWFKVTYSDGTTKTFSQTQTCTATLLSKEILESLTQEQRKSPDGNPYWTTTSYDDNRIWVVGQQGNLYADYTASIGVARFGFTI